MNYTYVSSWDCLALVFEVDTPPKLLSLNYIKLGRANVEFMFHPNLVSLDLDDELRFASDVLMVRGTTGFTSVKQILWAHFLSSITTARLLLCFRYAY